VVCLSVIVKPENEEILPH